jgi:hypothetical protein
MFLVSNFDEKLLRPWASLGQRMLDLSLTVKLKWKSELELVLMVD